MIEKRLLYEINEKRREQLVCIKFHLSINLLLTSLSSGIIIFLINYIFAIEKMPIKPFRDTSTYIRDIHRECLREIEFAADAVMEFLPRAFSAEHLCEPAGDREPPVGNR